MRRTPPRQRSRPAGKGPEILQFAELARRLISQRRGVIHGVHFDVGVRPVIVDKDNKPRWRPATLADVSEAEIERHFAPLGAGELVLP